MILVLCSGQVFCQEDSNKNQVETSRTVIQKPVNITDTFRTIAPAPVKKKIVVDSATRAYRLDSARKDSASLAMLQRLRDSLRSDSIRKTVAAAKLIIPVDTSTYRKYETSPYLALQKPAVFRISDYHPRKSKDELFYLMAGVVFCLAFIRAGFPKYFRNLFLLFFQTSLRQKQTRDQLLQDNFASLLINFLFFISGALYITLLIRYKNWTPVSFWVLALACLVALLLIYLGKYIFLLFAGWVFNAREAANSYVFLVFLVNKVMGVLLIPFLLLLSFASLEVVNVAVLLSFGVVGLLFLYRYFVSFNAIRSKLRVNLIHFFLYLCAVEVLPLLLIYKLLINYFSGSV